MPQNPTQLCTQCNTPVIVKNKMCGYIDVILTLIAAKLDAIFRNIFDRDQKLVKAVVFTFLNIEHLSCVIFLFYFDILHYLYIYHNLTHHFFFLLFCNALREKLPAKV
jgi:hypothetical protein